MFDDNTDTDGPGGGDVATDFCRVTRLTWDGNYVQDAESFGNGCPTTTPGIGDTGRTHFVRASDGGRTSSFALPRTEPGAYCTVHQGNIVSAGDRYLSVKSWYLGGVNVIDFTDPANPVEVTYKGIAPSGPTGSDNWSTYWYEGPTLDEDSLTIYATDSVHNAATGRGFQVFKADLSAEEATLDHLNSQAQG